VITFGLPKGRLADQVVDALGDIGPVRTDGRELVVAGRVEGVRFLLLKPPDVPAYVARGVADLGVAGLDVLREHPADVLEPVTTSLGRCRLSLCGRPGSDLEARMREDGLRVATKYPRMAGEALSRRGLVAELIPLHGSVELAVVVDLADAIVDLVETGATLRAHGLVEYATLAEVSARVVVNRASYALQREALAPFLERLGRCDVGR